MTKPFTILNEIENEDGQPPHLKKNKIISLLKKKFDFENSHLRPPNSKDKGILAKCFGYFAPEQAKELGIYPYFKAIEEIDGCHVVIDGNPAISVSTNNYLGLAQDPRIVSAARDALEKFGIGCTGSRFLNGTFNLHKTLEKEISSFLNREDSIVMSTGFQANQGTIACLLGRKDVAFSDRENHASIYEGCGVAPGKTVRYQHNDMDHLEYYLKKYSDVEGKIIITDTIFSMSGDIANLPAIVKLAKDYGASVMVDEAHGLGVLGERGKGVTNYYNLEDEIDIYMGTFSKSLGSIGGFISAKSKITDFIRHKASAFIFTAALPPASVAGVTAGLDVMINEPERIDKLRENTAYIKRGFFDMGFQVNNNSIPIVPIKIGEEALTLYLNRLLFDEGVFAGVAVSPVVPPLNAMIRTSYTSSHDKKDLDKVLGSFRKLGAKLGIIQK
ncbi:MAG: aminotransferase class I/II-fold pyridoxal phosphate-dependent enzyme [Nitrospinae bacterium]|nr:aminotransferase class I/II-fold pyridoxal phosphate-dependent enzyme [Nitrospinota bacterium]MZH41067.1 aminotransferase class I/II-fold pyridoxal phosphate-dependent enzyme [Nitrospinota bacterium]MZH46364.1 aminotransferase class I/II-fold pyridoxal phosphate-dependent enzyme [Nitrospinota bacterium]